MKSPFAKGRDGRSRFQPRALHGKPPDLTKTERSLIGFIDQAALCYDVIPDEPKPQTTALQRLQLAALMDAARVLAAAAESQNARGSQFTKDVWWIDDRRPSIPGFSLRDICDSLELDHGRVHEYLSAMAEKALRDPSARRQIRVATKIRRLKINAA